MRQNPPVTSGVGALTCAECGAELLPNAVFCVKCGARVVSEWESNGDEQTITVSRPTLRKATEPLSAPPREDKVAGGRPPIVRDPEDSETAEILVDAVALQSSWYLLLPDGSRVDAVLPLILGRKPSQDVGPEWAQLVTVADPAGDVSRNHVLIEPVGGTLKLSNVSRKNTIPVAWPDGVRYNILPGEHLIVANMCALKLGTVPILLQRA